MTTETTNCKACGRACENVGNGAVYLVREIQDTCSDCYGDVSVMDARLDVLDRN